MTNKVKNRTPKGGSSTMPKRTRDERNGGFLTLEDVADELAVTERMVRRLCHSGELRGTHIGKLLRVHRDDLNDYVSRQRGEGWR